MISVATMFGMKQGEGLFLVAMGMSTCLEHLTSVVTLITGIDKTLF